MYNPQTGACWRVDGKISTFGGPGDDPDAGNRRRDWKEEGLAMWDASELHRAPSGLFLAPGRVPPGLTGMARRLDPAAFYVAAQWDYKRTPRAHLQTTLAWICNPETRLSHQAWAVDFGPADRTKRGIDMSPGLAAALGLDTDDEATLSIALP